MEFWKQWGKILDISQWNEIGIGGEKTIISRKWNKERDEKANLKQTCSYAYSLKFNIICFNEIKLYNLSTFW